MEPHVGSLESEVRTASRPASVPALLWAALLQGRSHRRLGAAGSSLTR